MKGETAVEEEEDVSTTYYSPPPDLGLTESGLAGFLEQWFSECNPWISGGSIPENFINALFSGPTTDLLS